MRPYAALLDALSAAGITATAQQHEALLRRLHRNGYQLAPLVMDDQTRDAAREGVHLSFYAPACYGADGDPIRAGWRYALEPAWAAVIEDVITARVRAAVSAHLAAEPAGPGC